MERNAFIPKGLSLLSDPVVIDTLLAYRQCYGALISLDRNDPADIAGQLRQAIEAVDGELRERGIDAGGLLEATPRRTRQSSPPVRPPVRSRLVQTGR